MKLLEWKSFERVFWENEKERDLHELIEKMPLEVGEQLYVLKILTYLFILFESC